MQEFMQDLNWDNLRVFLAIARAGSMAGAAATAGLDQTTLSRRLSQLETALGSRLFERAGRRLTITAAGLHLKATAETLESSLWSNLAELASINGGAVGRVRIGAPEGLGLAYLSSRMGVILQGNPGVELELVALPQKFSLSSREVDIAITLDRPESGNLMVRKLTDYSLGFQAAQSYVERHGMPRTVQDLTQHTLCGYIPALLHTKELNYLTFDGITLRPQLMSTSIIGQRDIVLSGAALGILPDFVAAPHGARLTRVIERLRLKRSYWISVHDDLSRLDRIRSVIQTISDLVRSDRSLFIGA
jgi:DNA-binding transcriptional LysR family regulator